MRMNGKTGFALLLIAFGVLLLLNKFAGGLGWLMGYLIPVAIVGIGYVGIRSGSKFFGWVVFIVGLIMLLGKFSGLIGILVAVGLIAYGVSLLKRDRRAF